MTSVRVIVQQCLSARLQVRPATSEEANDAEYVEVRTFSSSAALRVSIAFRLVDRKGSNLLRLLAKGRSS